MPCSRLNRVVVRLLWLALLTAPAAHAAAGLFDSHEPIALTLEAPFGEIARDRAEEPEYRPATLRYTDADGHEHTLPIRLRPRGRDRRKPEICKFPPLRLAFDGDSAAGTPFEGQDKLKLVTYCQTSSAFQQYLLREFLVYRIHNALTEHSFRVRLLAVTYADTGGRRKPLERLGFVIEDRKDMARRSGVELSKLHSINRDELDPAPANLVELFQFLVGSTDWSMLQGPEGERCCHNAVLVSRTEGLFFPVPYDFDRTGLVDTPYAAPNPKLGIERVTQRLYRGLCRHNGQLDETIALFNAGRGEIERLVREQDGLTSRSRSTMLKFVDRFYDTVNDPRGRRRALEDDCR